MDYADSHDTLALCGNFGDVQFIQGDMKSLVDQSFELNQR